MGFEFKEGKERIPDEEDIYGVNDAEENQYDYEVWMPFEDRLRRRKRRLRIVAAVVVGVFALVFALLEFHSALGW